MKTLSQALAEGWKVCLPVKRFSPDLSLILIERNRTEEWFEAGFARMDVSVPINAIIPDLVAV
ncbi:MAG: hypothetical protein GIW99_01875 [Candidatus Eremiobacteraeota bacterium]|nr:hypothetical protein [Candidatus Eremiobacteraeota bacterium]MBC5826424.1 hypothetical protein [Candidatus Eremiobacteraeota bacterium]